jgi:hypothetical protein
VHGRHGHGGAVHRDGEQRRRPRHWKLREASPDVLRRSPAHRHLRPPPPCRQGEGSRRAAAKACPGGGGGQVRVLRHVAGVYAGVHARRSGPVRRAVGLRAVRRGRDGGGREERRQAGGGAPHAHGRVQAVQRLRAAVPGAVPGPGHEGDPPATGQARPQVSVQHQPQGGQGRQHRPQLQLHALHHQRVQRPAEDEQELIWLVN